jgi:gluconate 2-dehydrogenase gamma chain
MDRRELFPILAAAAVVPLEAQHEHHKPALVSTDKYKLQAFSAEQNEALDQLADIILPRDASSGGAHDARVSQYIDLVAFHVPAVKAAFEEGLREMDSLAQSRFGHPLSHLDRAQRTTLLEIASAHELAPTNPLERFFELLKFHTVEGYRLSHIGQTEWMGYKPHPPGLYPDLTVD